MTYAEGMSMNYTFTSILILGFFFAKLEIAIEGDAGWAENLPTWRIEGHWLLDLFWGGRVMTGYHAWAFSLVAFFFISHLSSAGITYCKQKYVHWVALCCFG